MSVTVIKEITYTSARNSRLEGLAAGYLEDIKNYSGVDVTVHENGVTVKGPYDRRFVNAARKIGGKWNAQEQAWAFPVEVSADAIHAAHEEYSHLG